MATALEPSNIEEVEPPPPPPLPLISAPIDIRSTSLALIALIALIGFLHWSRAVLIPITFAVLLSYALTPIVEWLKKSAKLHKALGAALTLIAIVGVLGIGLASLQPKALNILDILPRATEKFRKAMVSNSRTTPGAVDKIQKAATEIEKDRRSYCDEQQISGGRTRRDNGHVRRTGDQQRLTSNAIIASRDRARRR